MSDSFIRPITPFRIAKPPHHRRQRHFFHFLLDISAIRHNTMVGYDGGVLRGNISCGITNDATGLRLTVERSRTWL